MWNRSHLQHKTDCPPLQTEPQEMPGPAQLAVYRLKVVKPNEAEVRQALHHLGYSRSRVSQLLAECQRPGIGFKGNARPRRTNHNAFTMTERIK